MSSLNHGRHRAATTHTGTLTSLSKAVSSNAGTLGRQAAVIAAASGLVLAAGVPAQASAGMERQALDATTLNISGVAVSVPANAPFTLTGLQITAHQSPKSESGKAKEAEKAAADAAAAEQAAAEAAAAEQAAAEAAAAEQAAAEAAAVEAVVLAPAAPVAAPAAPVAAPAAPAAPVAAPAAPAAPAAAPAPKAPAAAPAVKSGLSSTIASAALAQVGVMQDCTMLATNALAAAGINFHDWPAGYLSLGRTVGAGEAIPGDLIYYADGGMGMAHIAVYIGGGQAVHGGFNGNTTVIAPAELGSGGVYIRVGG